MATLSKNLQKTVKLQLHIYDTIISKEAHETKEFEGTIWTDRDFIYWLKGEWNGRSEFLESYRESEDKCKDR
ncbi:MAG: hypothetical protein LWX01_07145 [Deltaproteobacteria bacterium]|nr:hypothetical protein [Deltaproteobacteria bacterium]